MAKYAKKRFMTKMTKEKKMLMIEPYFTQFVHFIYIYVCVNNLTNYIKKRLII